MRVLELHEINTIAGAGADDMTCSIGFPSGVKCEGSVADIKSAALDTWNFFAGIPGTMPSIAEHIWAKL